MKKKLRRLYVRLMKPIFNRISEQHYSHDSSFSTNNSEERKSLLRTWRTEFNINNATKIKEVEEIEQN